MKILDIGCGKNKEKRAIGIDFNPDSDADIIWDLNKYPYPFDDNEFDLVYCKNILEHLDNVPKTMEEIYRITKNNAEIIIFVPFASSDLVYTDPTHKRGFTSRSFDYFIPGTKLYQYGYSKAKFKLCEVTYEKFGDRRKFIFDRFLLFLANKYKHLYESRFAYIYPVKHIYFRLKTIK